MMTVRMKRIRLVVGRADFENVLRELMSLACVEITEPDALPEGCQLQGQVKRVIVELSGFGANLDSIMLLGTQYTLVLTGWMAARSGPELAARMGNYVCAWEIVDPSPDESAAAPVKLRLPGLFGLFHRGGGKPFSPFQAKADEQ